MARLRLVSDEELKSNLSDKIQDGKEIIDRLQIEWVAARNIYQGITQRGDGGVDSSQVQALMYPDQHATVEDPYIDSTKLLNLMIGLHAKLCISDPAMTTKAFNRDYPNIKAAENAQIVVEHIRQSTDLKSVLEKGAYLSTSITGVGVIFNGWDPDGGRVIEDAETIQALKAAGKLDETDIAMEGDYEFRNVKPDNFLIDPNANEFTDADWCAERRQNIPLQKALWKFPDHAEFLNELAKKQCEQDPTAKSEEEKRRKRASNVELWEYWERARPWNGMLGLYVVFAELGGQIYVLHRSENPFNHKQLPYAVLTDLDIEESPYGQSRAVLGIPAQEAVNQLYLQVMANIELHGSIRLLWPENGTPDDIDSNHPAIRISYNPATGEKPTYLQPGNVTSDIWRLHTLLNQELDQIFASSEFDRGEINRELSSYAVQVAIERSEAKMVRLFSKKKMFLKRIFEQALSNTIQYVTEYRLFRTVGHEESHNNEFLRGADLEGNYGLFVDFGMYMPVDPHARKQQVLELVKSGIYEKAGGNMQKLVKILVDGDMLDVRDLFEQAKRVQEEEFMRLIEGEPAPVQPWHEHLSHYSACAEFTQKKFFEALPEDAKKRIYEHMELHKQEAAKIQAAAQQAAPQAPQGAQQPAAGTPTQGQASPQSDIGGALQQIGAA